MYQRATIKHRNSFLCYCKLGIRTVHAILTADFAHFGSCGSLLSQSVQTFSVAQKPRRLLGCMVQTLVQCVDQRQIQLGLWGSS